MAHSASLHSAATELIYKIVGPSASDNPRKFRRTRDAVLRGLRSQQWARVNQFDVQSSYEGLIEKFIVRDREDLAEALEDRVRELLRLQTKTTPDILALFLSLSDRPVENSSLEDLERIKPPKPAPELTWAEIIADDPLDEEGIWDDIDYAAESSEDEQSEPAPRQRKRAATEDTTPASSVVDEDEFTAAAEACIISPDPSVLQGIEEAQFWRQSHKRDSMLPKPETHITELQAVRETLFMLRGVPASLFTLNKDLRRMELSKNYALSHTAIPTWQHQLQELAGIGTTLLQLRFWVKFEQTIALLQTFRAAIVEELRSFDTFVAQLQDCCLGSGRPVTVSLIAVTTKVRQRASPLLRIRRLITEASQSAQRSPFLLLEGLYDEINMAQMAGDADLFSVLSRIFFRCLQTYLKPIRRWMEEGELGINDQIFFVGTVDKSSEAASLWHDQFILRRDQLGKLHAPSFLHPAAKRIFNSGKSVIFLKELGHHLSDSSDVTEPRLDLEAVCGASTFDSSSIPLAPFSELFGFAFEDWIRSKYTFASSILRERLFSGYGLWESLDALDFIYLSKDGSLMQAFADTVFEKLDRGRRGWNDRYVMSEIARSIYGTVPSVLADKLAIRTVSVKEKSTSPRSVKALAAIAVDYFLPWHIVNVIQRHSTATYQRVFVLLLQVYRARYVLRTSSLWRSTAALHRTTTPQNQRAAAAAKHKHLQYHLRHRLLWLADTLHSYLTETVFAASTASLRAALARAADIDEMAAVHAAHVAALEDRCLLAPRLAPLHGALVELLDLCVAFADLVAASEEEEEEGQEGRMMTAAAAEWGRSTVGGSADGRRRVSGVAGRKRPGVQKGGRRVSGLQVALAEVSDESSEDEAEGGGGGGAELDGEDGGVGKKGRKRSAVRERGSMQERLGRMKEAFEKHFAFVIAGLRGVSRAGGERCWEVLAERLEWEAAQGKVGGGRG
ncbi:gamma-tubulin complex component [Diplodia corticola]|uniref:Spindle pole body component n=1 Tax=Diplodia corticola TaxID=236234 RepID=A0A1J9QZG6_9PEZI|nr:gamma-tubulin complex component [Diplodia corticola]OJD33378.1 gamma-tubulin complex component [Diplodia corticola]